MSLKGSPYMPELDVRLDTIEDNRVTDAAAIAVLQTASFDLSASANTETSTTNAGALSVSKPVSLISTAGAESRTLAAPSATSPMIKIIRMSVDGGNCTLAGTNVLGRSAVTATFGDVGDCLVLANNGSSWVELSNPTEGGYAWA